MPWATPVPIQSKGSSRHFQEKKDVFKDCSKCDMTPSNIMTNIAEKTQTTLFFIVASLYLNKLFF